MMLIFVLLFILTLLTELAILFYLGINIGIFYTILIVITTGSLGAFIAGKQGLGTISRIRSSIERGIVPSDEMFFGALIVVGGLLLLSPGLITDIIGFTLLIPQARNILGRRIGNLIRYKIQRGQVQY